MKQIILLAILGAAFLAPGVSKAQTIPNGSFEDWQTTSVPKNWTVISGTITKLAGVQYSKTVNGSTENVFRPAKDGSSCILMQNLVNGSNLSRAVIKDSFPCTSKPDYFAMNYAYFGSGQETFGVVIYMTSWNTTTKQRDTVLKAAVTGPVTSFVEPWMTMTNAQLTSLYTSGTPDTCRILVLNTIASTSTQNTTLLIDNMWFSTTAPTGINEGSFTSGNVNAYPNPFSGKTNIHYNLNEAGNVTLKVYDASGKEVADLVNENQTAGAHDVNFDATDLKGGLYFYRLQSGAAVETGKLILNK